MRRFCLFREECMGRCTAGKMQRILASEEISQHAKLNMAGFVLYLPRCVGLRYRMVELRPNLKKMNFPMGKCGRNRNRHAKAKTFYHRGQQEHPPQRAKIGLAGSPGHGGRQNLTADPW
jgi:hypothetical protein